MKEKIKAGAIYIAQMVPVFAGGGIFFLFLLWCGVKDEGPYWTFGHFLWELYHRTFQ